MKALILLLFLAPFIASANKLKLEFNSGISKDSGDYTPTYYDDNKVMVDVSINLMYEATKTIDIGCGLYHQSNPSTYDYITKSGIEGVRCGVSLKLYSWNL